VFPVFTCKIDTMTPNKPIALPNISTIRILTNNDEFCASANAAPEPTIPTQTPQKRLDQPTVMPAPNIANPASTCKVLQKEIQAELYQDN
jgi:hypothetical protein